VRFEGAFGNVFVSDLKNGAPNRLSFGKDNRACPDERVS
jgi:hypothetical protein